MVTSDVLRRKYLLLSPRLVCGAVLIQCDVEYQGTLQKADACLLSFLPGNTPVVAGIDYLLDNHSRECRRWPMGIYILINLLKVFPVKTRS